MMLEAVIFYTFYLVDVEPKSITQGYFWNSEHSWTLSYCENYVLPEVQVNLNDLRHVEIERIECVMREVVRENKGEN